jgi:cytochrome c biogenesis protein CcdA
MTAIGWLLVLGLIAFFTLITLRLVPLYLEYAKVASALESLENEPGITRKTKTEIVNMMQKRFDVNDVNNVSAKEIKV